MTSRCTLMQFTGVVDKSSQLLEGCCTLHTCRPIPEWSSPSTFARSSVPIRCTTMSTEYWTEDEEPYSTTAIWPLLSSTWRLTCPSWNHSVSYMNGLVHGWVWHADPHTMFLGVGKFFRLMHSYFFSRLLNENYFKFLKLFILFFIKFCSHSTPKGAPVCTMTSKSYDWIVRNSQN